MLKRLRAGVHQMPTRTAAGAYILHSGLDKLGADGDRAKGVHGMASEVYPFAADMEPEQFVRLLALAEIGIGAALLLPFIPDRLAGLPLAAFGGGLVGLYLRTPSLHKEGSIWPTQQGTAVSKDVWLLGMGLSLLLTPSTRRAKTRAAKAALKQAKAA
ncbi:MAG TPA: hypothetical protein VE991_11140 [Acidimicrobiales bacterium]|nr:hypothetical protein [Acidimicrobiales bacterium]